MRVNFYLLFLIVFSLNAQSQSIDDALRAKITQAGVYPLELNISIDPQQVELGRMLYFDKILSGNKDIACSTCHLASQLTGDGLSLSIGTGGSGLGQNRKIGEGRSFIPRNAPDIFNRGVSTWTSMFWDSRVSQNNDGSFSSPAGQQLPDTFSSVLAVQAMFPVTSRDEMRGAAGDRDVFGRRNEIAAIADSDFTGIWKALMRRLMRIGEYKELFRSAFQGVNYFNFDHAAQAIAAFESSAFHFPRSPFDRYLRGDDTALSTDAKRGAELFFGDASCSSCHNGPLLTDQRHYNLLVPQFGPGKGTLTGKDLGRGEATQNLSDFYAFRTPALRNVAITAPYMHNGAFDNLWSVVFHHMEPQYSCSEYDPTRLHEMLQPSYDPSTLRDMEILYTNPLPVPYLSNDEMDAIIAFLHALTDPDALDMYDLVPDRVPSGLPIDG